MKMIVCHIKVRFSYDIKGSNIDVTEDAEDVTYLEKYNFIISKIKQISCKKYY